MTQGSYNRARYYDEQVGRFSSEDRKKFNAGINFYEYVFNRPVSLNDPFGIDVNVCYYPNGGPFGHIGFGISPEPVTSGFYPLFSSGSPWYTQQRRPYGPGIVKPDIGDGQYFCILIKTTPDQDRCLHNCRNERAANPGTYNFLTRQCTGFVRDCLKRCGIPVGPYTGIYPDKLANSIAIAND